MDYEESMARVRGLSEHALKREPGAPRIAPGSFDGAARLPRRIVHAFGERTAWPGFEDEFVQQARAVGLEPPAYRQYLKNLARRNR